MAMTQILLELTKVQQHYMQEQRVDVLRGAVWLFVPAN